jgi:hypothetical protein
MRGDVLFAGLAATLNAVEIKALCIVSTKSKANFYIKISGN